jgi:hypothetical protein
MAKKDYYLIIDTETTVKDHVVDFGAVICDRKGNIYHQCGVLLAEYFNVEALFYRNDLDSSDIWSKQGKDRRLTTYQTMLLEGTRMLASVAAVNRWLERARGQYDPVLTAYNLAFDLDKCQKTGIDLSIFSNRFCLWHAAAGKYGQSRLYRQFILDNHEFNTPTQYGNMTYKTNAEVMARFVLGQPELENEPHTALEDAIGYELPILTKLLHKSTKKRLMHVARGYNWRDYQVKDHFKPI